MTKKLAILRIWVDSSTAEKPPHYSSRSRFSCQSGVSLLLLPCFAQSTLTVLPLRKMSCAVSYSHPVQLIHAAEFHTRSVAKTCQGDLQDAIYTPVKDSPPWTEFNRCLRSHGQHTIHAPPSHTALCSDVDAGSRQQLMYTGDIYDTTRHSTAQHGTTAHSYHSDDEHRVPLYVQPLVKLI